MENTGSFNCVIRFCSVIYVAKFGLESVNHILSLYSIIVQLLLLNIRQSSTVFGHYYECWGEPGGTTKAPAVVMEDRLFRNKLNTYFNNYPETTMTMTTSANKAIWWCGDTPRSFSSASVLFTWLGNCPPCSVRNDQYFLLYSPIPRSAKRLLTSLQYHSANLDARHFSYLFCAWGDFFVCVLAVTRRQSDRKPVLSSLYRRRNPWKGQRISWPKAVYCECDQTAAWLCTFVVRGPDACGAAKVFPTSSVYTPYSTVKPVDTHIIFDKK